MGESLPEYAFKAQSIIDEGRVTREEIETFRMWLQTVTVPELNDEQIVCFLLSCERDQEFTQKTVREYFKARKNAPELFNNRNMEEIELQKQLKVVEFSMFPRRTNDGCAVLFHRLHDTRYSYYSMEPSMKLLFMTLDIAVYEGPPTGLLILFDMKGLGLMHLTRARMHLIKKFFHYTQEALPVKLKQIHVMNTVYFLDKIMAIIKPFLSKEVAKLIHFHRPDVNMEEFYEKYIPKRCLPSDFGGELPSTQVLQEENSRKLQQMLPFFSAEEKQRLDME